MATGQDILDRMELLDQELQLQPTEADVARALIAINTGQDYLESILALQHDLLGDATGTLVTAASTESTAFPPGVLRIDRLQLLDATTSRPIKDLENIRRTGGHVSRRFSPYWSIFNAISTGSGKPYGYWTDGTNVYWQPLPDGAHTIRWYGFQHKPDVTATGTFLYSDMLMLPVAAFATKMMAIGKGDEAGEFSSLADSLFGPAVRSMSNFNRDGAVGLEYEYSHAT
jgi:hypothetical protein